MSVAKPEHIPNLKPVLFIDMVIPGGPTPVLNNSARSINVAVISEGSIKSVDPEYPFEADVLHCYDELTTASTGTVSQLDCKVWAKTKSGKGIQCTYFGVVRASPKLGELITSTGEFINSFEDMYVTCNPVFQLDDNIEKEYKWVLEENFIGKGRFIRDAEGKIRVQYYVYVLA